MNLDTHQYELDLLGSIVQNGVNLDAIEIIDKMPNEAWTSVYTKAMFSILKKMIADQEIVNMTTVATEMESHDAFDAPTSDLIDFLKATHCSPAQYKAYAKRIRQSMYVRETIKGLEEARELLIGNGNINEVATKISNMLGGMTLETDRKLPRTLDEIAHDYPDELEKRVAPSAITTPFADMNKAQGRVNAEDLIIIAARPAMGKTELAAAIANCVGNDKSVYIATMEMSEVQIFERLMSIEGNYSSQLLRNFYDQDDVEQGRALAPMGEIASKQVYIQDSVGLSVTDIEKDCEYVKRRTNDLGLIVIDYFGLINVGDGNRTAALGEASRSLKKLAKKIKTPIILLCQLNRKVEERQDKHPVMADLRETGDLEQDADQIIFIYRDEVYNPDSNRKGTAEIYWGKHRHGDLSKAKCTLTFTNGHFNNYCGPDFEEYDSRPEPNERGFM